MPVKADFSTGLCCLLIQAAAGWEWSRPDGDRPIAYIGGRLTYGMTESLWLDVFASYSSTARRGAGDGFSRAAFGIEARMRW
ncbi:hypothetical protein [Chelativorans salis]|uniref:Uncharacterized protein n=1 Tax=Chelativorans salis TaxID=2978478 RepID=A0ABT2LU96_9HYPH|nr:hypothetical protein [Chelativorans sp. EGI FJ00035]MCT7378084.1 hypothetical protein [Chelativorans sp. EGI FJ00035]